jgi:hypothetical protein
MLTKCPHCRRYDDAPILWMGRTTRCTHCWKQMACLPAFRFGNRFWSFLYENLRPLFVLLLFLPGSAMAITWGEWQLSEAVGDIGFSQTSNSVSILLAPGDYSDNRSITLTTTVAMDAGETENFVATFGHLLDGASDVFRLRLTPGSFVHDFAAGDDASQFTAPTTRTYSVSLTYEIGGGNWSQSSTPTTLAYGGQP